MRTRTAMAWVGVVLLAVMLFSPSSVYGEIDINVGVGVSVTDVSLGEALLIGAVGSFFGLDTTVVASLHKTVDEDGNEKVLMPLPEVMMTAYLSRLAGVDCQRVVALKSRGRGWGRIAKDLGIHPGTFNKMRKDLDIDKADNATFEEAAYVWFLSDYYGCPQQQVIDLRKEGHAYLSIFVGLDFSLKAGRPVGDMMAERKKAESWEVVAKDVGLSEEAVKHPGKPKGGSEFRGPKDKDDKGDKGDKPDKGDKGDQPGGKPDKGDKGDKADKGDQPGGKPDKGDPGDKGDKPGGKPDKGDKGGGKGNKGK